MKRTLVVALAAAGCALGAQAAKVAYPQSEIRESTDPAKVAAVERHAAALGAPVGTMSGSGTSAASDKATKKTGKHPSRKKAGKKAGKASEAERARSALQGS